MPVTQAVRNLGALDEFSDDLIRELSLLPGFRNVLVHRPTGRRSTSSPPRWLRESMKFTATWLFAWADEPRP